MNIPEHLPEKLSIHILYEYLEISDFTLKAKLDYLVNCSQSYELLFTFDEVLRGLPHNDSKELPCCEITPANSVDIRVIFSSKSFILDNHNSKEGKVFTSIFVFQSNGAWYDIVNTSKSDFTSHDIYLEKTYVKKSDFIKFLENRGDNKATAQASQENNSKNSTANKRYDFLKQWTQKKLPDVPLNEFIAKYDSQLTKKTFYQLLSKEYEKSNEDSNIFVSGQDSFYKDKRVTLRFQQGRRKKSS